MPQEEPISLWHRQLDAATHRRFGIGARGLPYRFTQLAVAHLLRKEFAAMLLRLAARWSLGLLLGICLTSFACGDDGATGTDFDDVVTVQVASGRTFSGRLDLESDPAELRLQAEYGDGVIVRPIDWDRVVEVEIAGQTCTGEQLREALRTLQANQPHDRPPAPSRRWYGVTGPVVQVSDRAAPAEEFREGHIESLQVEAATARWDANVEIDGLAVRILPLDANGLLTPVEGTLDAELISDQVGTPRPDQPLQVIGHWQQAVHAGDFDASGAPYRLNFQGVHPEFDRRWGTHAALHVRLSVPGQGVFEATQDFLRIRPYSPIRDELEQTTGHRYFPQERIGDGRR
jgi:hypothetical protein